LATFLFLSNIYFWRDSSYFAAAEVHFSPVGAKIVSAAIYEKLSEILGFTPK